MNYITHCLIRLEYEAEREGRCQALGEELKATLGENVYDGWGTDEDYFEYFLYLNDANVEALLSRALPLIPPDLAVGGEVRIRGVVEHGWALELSLETALADLVRFRGWCALGDTQN